jgi:GTP-binding protein
VVDVAPVDPGIDPVREAKSIVRELKRYDPGLHRKPRWLVLNKSDLISPHERSRSARRFLRRFGWRGRSFIISALTGEGCAELAYAIMDYLDQAARPEKARARAPRAKKTRTK